MQSTTTESIVKDNVVRATQACWVETVLKECIDVSKYPRIGIVVDEQRDELLFGVVAFKKIDNDDDFEILFESEEEYAARKFYSELVSQLQSTLSIVH